MRCYSTCQCNLMLHYIRGAPFTDMVYSKFQRGLIAWIDDYIHHTVWDEITHPFPNFNGCTVEVWEWISNFIPHFTWRMVVNACGWNVMQHILTISETGAQWRRKSLATQSFSMYRLTANKTPKSSTFLGVLWDGKTPVTGGFLP